MEAIRRNLALLETIYAVDRFLLEAFDQRSFLNKLESVMQLVRRGATEGERNAGKMALERLRSRAETEMKSMSRNEIINLRNAITRVTSNDKPQEPPRNPPPPPPPRAALFRMGQWVVVKDGQDDAGRVGKISEIRKNLFDDSFNYTVKMSDAVGKFDDDDLFNEDWLRAATQEDLDAAVSHRPTSAKFEIGMYVVSTDDDKVGKITDTGWDRSTHSRWYTIEFFDGESDMLEERHLREASHAEVARAKPQKARMSNDVQAFARFINPAQNSNKVYGVVKRNGKYFTFWGGFGKALAIKQFRDLNDAMLQYRAKEMSGYKQTPPLGETASWIDRALNERFAKLGESRAR